jgi:hypothetical protein
MAYKRIEMTIQELKEEIIKTIKSWITPKIQKRGEIGLPGPKYLLEELNRGGKLEVNFADLIIPINELIIENKLAVQVATSSPTNEPYIFGFIIPCKLK